MNPVEDAGIHRHLENPEIDSLSSDSVKKIPAAAADAKPLTKSKWMRELRAIRLLRNTAGQAAAVVKPKRFLGWVAAMAAMGR